MSGLRATFRTAEGWAVEHAVLTVTDPAGRQVTRQAADVRGEVVTDALAPGTYTAVVTAAGYTPVARMAQVASDGSGSLGDVVLAPVAEAIDLPPAGPWVIDPMHSSVVATARHLGIASIKARFPDVSGRIDIGRPAERSSVHAEIKAASIDTGIKMRDDHLRSPDFLGVDEHPLIEYRGTGITSLGGEKWQLNGELSLNGIQRPVPMELTYLGVGDDPWGGVRAAFHAVTDLKQEDFAITYNQIVKAGLNAIGATLRVEIDIEAVRGDSLPMG
jgi:polyisoprenoid-binding protein YceI